MDEHPSIERLIESILVRAPTQQLEVACRGLDLNEVGVRGRTPLMVAAAIGLLEVVELLVRNGASVHTIGCSDLNALHEAAANDHASVVRYLLAQGADVNAETIDGCTPLMCAAAWGNLETAKLLLKNGADRTKRDRRGGTAADIAGEKGEDAAADLIGSYSNA